MRQLHGEASVSALILHTNPDGRVRFFAANEALLKDSILQVAQRVRPAGRYSPQRLTWLYQKLIATGTVEHLGNRWEFID